jgi:hypothetical protein
MLLLGDCELFGLEESEELSFVVRDTGYPLISVVGRPSDGGGDSGGGRRSGGL